MLNEKTQEIQENSSVLEIAHNWSTAKTTYSAGVTIVAPTENYQIKFVDETVILDCIKIFNTWDKGQSIPKPHIELHFFGMYKNGKLNDSKHRRVDFDARYMHTGMSAELLSEAVKAYWAQAEAIVEGK